MLDLGVTGPMLRAAGLKWDTRKRQPYSGYDQFDFEIPTHRRRRVCPLPGAHRGDAAERAHRETGARRHAGRTHGQADAPHVVLPDREKMKTQMEALIYHFKIVTEGFRVPAGEVYQVIESPRGEVGYYVVSDGTTESLPRALCADRVSAICRPCPKWWRAR
jgi:NADH-quinone oxidoreductase subunit D